MRTLTLTLDRATKRQHPVKASRAERFYGTQLRAVARQVGTIINGFPPGDPASMSIIEDILRRYAETLTPWATETARRMVDEVSNSDAKAWKRITSEIGRALGKEIQSAPTGEAMRKLMQEQVTLIKSIPLSAAQRVHDLTIKGIEDGTRAKQIATEIMRSSEVAQSRAMLIARTEVARTASNLTQARAQYVGSTHYIWRTSKDGDVRKDHRMLDGKVFAWADPPVADESSGARSHPGCIYNCRCWAEVILPE